jgi:dipeptidyl aminopeptidase/acylaminoacyl peptidase
MKTDKINAAAVIGGVADLEMMNKNRPDIMEKMVFRQLIPSYWLNKNELLQERSAITRVNEICKTSPILLMHGTADWRVSPMQSINLATAFQEQKIPYRLVLMEGADHGLTEFKEESDHMIKEWFDRFLIQNEELPKLEKHGN